MWLLFRRGDCLWAVAGSRVKLVIGADRGSWLQVGEHRLVADEVLRLTRLQRIYRLGPVLRSLAPSGCTGLATCELGPLVVIDPESPPAQLIAGHLSAAQEEVNDVS
jgi:hypothetical protein